MFQWLREWWDDWSENALDAMKGAAFVCFLVAGFYVAYKRPPRVVDDRHWFIRMVDVCDSTDDKGNCTARHSEPQTVYVLDSKDGATCEVESFQYYAVKKGDLHKCWQLFGWRGGVSDDVIDAHTGGF